MKKNYVVVCLLMMMVSVFAGCSKSDQETVSQETAHGANQTADSEKIEGSEVKATEEAKEELVFVNFRDIRDLNPHLYAGEMYAQEILYDTLVTITETGYEGCLAESWEISDDGKVYTFHIRPNVYFSDGEICDAHAIKANFDAIIENKERHTWLAVMNLLVSVEATDDMTFVITLSEPYYPLLTELGVTRPFAMLSPKAMIDGSTKDGVLAHIGTGPYVLTDFVIDEYAVFEVNDTYWGEKPAIDKITVKVIPDNQTRILALEKGEIDLIYGKNMIDAEAISQYMDQEGFTVALSDPTSTRQLVINTTDEILSDIKVRTALQHATNKGAISEGIFYGIEKPADTLFAETVPYCDIDLVPYQYDLDLAASLLDEAGWVVAGNGIREKEGKKLEFELLFNSSSVTEKSIAEYLQAEYLNLGIKMNISGAEEQAYRDRMKAGDFDVVFNISWGLPYDPQSSLSGMTAPVYGDYAAQLGLSNKAEIDSAIAKVLVSTSEEERQDLYRFILTALHEDAVYLPLTYECNKAIYQSSLDGVTFGQSQYEVPFRFMYFK